MDNMEKLLAAKKECSEDSDCSECIFGQIEDRCILAELQTSLENDKNNAANIYIKRCKHEQLITCIYKRYVEKSTFITLCYTKQQKYVPLSYVELTEENSFPEYFEAGNSNPLDGYERAEEIKELMRGLETNLKELAASYNYVQRNTDKGMVLCNTNFIESQKNEYRYQLGELAALSVPFFGLEKFEKGTVVKIVDVVKDGYLVKAGIAHYFRYGWQLAPISEKE